MGRGWRGGEEAGGVGKRLEGWGPEAGGVGIRLEGWGQRLKGWERGWRGGDNGGGVGIRRRGGEEADRGGEEAGGNSPLTTRSSPRAEHDEV